MANTKSIVDRSERKAKKRAQRKAFKSTFSALSQKDKRAFRKAEPKMGLRAWIAENKSE